MREVTLYRQVSDGMDGGWMCALCKAGGHLQFKSPHSRRKRDPVRLSRRVDNVDQNWVML